MWSLNLENKCVKSHHFHWFLLQKSLKPFDKVYSSVHYLGIT